jgi:6-pyruvoyltetrahydropterin/6-carboxytetrahydropterin synthase
MQTMTRKGTFDAAHRVMNEKVKCFNLHGHTYLYELTFEFITVEEIGFAVDFKDVKAVAMQFIDDVFDHCAIINPLDVDIVKLVKDNGWRLYEMSIGGKEYCNPTAENIVKEVFLGVQYLMNTANFKLKNIRLYETPNCFVDCAHDDITDREAAFWGQFALRNVMAWETKHNA